MHAYVCVKDHYNVTLTRNYTRTKKSTKTIFSLCTNNLLGYHNQFGKVGA